MTGAARGRTLSLDPTGTARALFLETGASSDPESPLPPELRTALAAHDVGDDILWAAWEVSTWAAAAPIVERRALACLIVALLDSVESGGTFLPLTSAPGAIAAVTNAPATPTAAATLELLAAALRRLGVTDVERRATCELAARLTDGTAAASIAALIGPPGSRRPFILSDGALYPERFWMLEDRLVTGLRARLARPLPALSNALDETVAAASGPDPRPVPLGPEQLSAIHAALTNSLTIIAGGPGTGKTSTVVGLLHALAGAGVRADEIALAAPTGRAASRINESLDAALGPTGSAARTEPDAAEPFARATTIHRLLGVRAARRRALEPDQPEFYGDWPLPHRIVIVDEASMIDLVTMDQLVAAVAPTARLVLIGDADQLPSVEVGAVFRDLVAGVSAPSVCRLTHSHRLNPSDPLGGEILRVAQSVNAGTPDFGGVAVLEQADQLSFSGFERLCSAPIEGFLDRWHRDVLGAERTARLAAGARFAVDQANHIIDGSGGDSSTGDLAAAKTLIEPALSARILCLTRVAGRASSASAINRLMHARYQAAFLAAGGPDTPAVAAATFIPGEPVIVTRNDHLRGLANGDLGVVVRLADARGDRLGVAFARGGDVVVHALDSVRATLELAFALTVHKAQGSEYDRVALVLPEVDVPLLTREVIYTALTRARRGVVVVGDPALLALAATRTLNRNSGIARKLAAAA